MNQKRPSQDKEMLELIKRFEAMKEEGKIPYLDVEQYEDIIEFFVINKEYNTAADVIEMALQIHPGNTRFVATRVALYIDEEKFQEARELINTVLDDNSFHIRLIHAELLVIEGNDKKANRLIDSFKEDITEEMDCLDVGVLCNDVGLYEKALYWLKKCLKINPENEEATLALCESYQSMGQYEDTIELYNQLIDKDPYSAESWSGLGKSYFYLGQFDKAIEACDFALVSNEKAGEAYTIKGHAYYQLENYDESVKAYKEAWRLGSLETEFAPMFIAFSYIGMEEWDNAYEYIKKAIARTDEDSHVFPDLLINSARCLAHMNKMDEVHSTLEFVQERYPDNVLAYIYNGKYYLEESNRDKATENFEKGVAISPTADTWYQIGLIAMNSEDYDIAKDAFEHVEKINPKYEDLGKNMAYVARRLVGDNYLSVNRKMLKQHLRSLVVDGERPELINIEDHVREAQEEGKTEEEIEELINALEQLNDILENFDIDQEEDEEEEEEDEDEDEDDNNEEEINK